MRFRDVSIILGLLFSTWMPTNAMRNGPGVDPGGHHRTGKFDDESTWRFVALVPSNWAMHVFKLILSHGITAAVDGSVMWTVRVSRPLWKKTVRLVKADAKKWNYWAKFSDGIQKPLKSRSHT